MPIYTNTNTLPESLTTMQAVQELTYRLYEKKDIPGIISLWENHSEWGAITEQQFYEWYVDIPDGKCLVLVAENENDEIIAQGSLIPANVSIEGTEVRSLRLSAPIVHKASRLSSVRNGDHVTFQMLKHSFEKAREMGFSLLYALPAVGWLGFLRILPQFGLPNFLYTSFPCEGISLENEGVWETINNNQDDVTVVGSFDDSYNELWKEAVNSFPIKCGVVRHSARLQWKISHHLVFEIRKAGKLKGYVAIKKEEGLLTDILARNPKDMSETLHASLKAIHVYNKNRFAVPFKAVKLMMSPHMRSIVDPKICTSVNFQFGFACCPVKDSVDVNSILPENWYIMPND